MSEKFSYLPDESQEKPPVVADRAKVFEGETPEESLRVWEPVFQFAREGYREIRRDIPLPEHPETVNEMVRTVQDEVYGRTAEYIPKVLEKTTWDVAHERALIDAVTERNYSGINLKDAAMTKAALGLSLVSERAGAATMSDALRKLSPEDLKRFGMDDGVRDILADSIPRLTASNAEYVRLWARALGGRGREERPVDAAREHTRMGRALADMKSRLAETSWFEGFGDTREEFLEYLEKLEGAYRPFNQDGDPYTRGYRDRVVKEAYTSFLDFYKAHPEFPLILIPQNDSMLGEDAEVEGSLGYDPEIRILWQSERERGIAHTVEALRGDFVSALSEAFPEFVEEEDLAAIKESRAFVGNDLAALGANMKFRGVAQEGEDRNWNLLVENAQWREYTRPAKEKIKKLIPVELQDIVDDASFGDLMNMLSFFHEFIHRVYSDQSKSAERLGDLNDRFSESKSDTIARVVFARVMGPEAQRRFGVRATEALNLAMLGDDLVNYYDGNPEGEDAAYWFGASSRLAILAQEGVFTETDKEVAINLEKLKEDWGAYMIPLGKEILEMYMLAKTDLKGAQKLAARLEEIPKESIIEEVGKYLVSKK